MWPSTTDLNSLLKDVLADLHRSFRAVKSIGILETTVAVTSVSSLLSMVPFAFASAQGFSHSVNANRVEWGFTVWTTVLILLNSLKTTPL